MASDAGSGRIAGLKPASQWLVLLVGSAVLAAAFTWMGVPAALLLGAMVAAIGLGTAGHGIAVPRVVFAWGQGMIGCLIARSFTLPVSADLWERWPLFVAGVVAVIGTSTLLGWWMAKSRLLPGSTAIWGMSPGAASAMAVLSAHHGADARLVALMQYLRVLLVAGLASAVAHVLAGTGNAAPAAVPAAPMVHWAALAVTLALSLTGPVAERLLKSPSVALMFPLFAGIGLQRVGVMHIELPHGVLALAYAVIGWSIGLKFTLELLRYAARLMPFLVACSCALIAICAGFAALLVVLAGVDPMSAYLALSPGGIDSVAIIAVVNRIDEPFVMTMQLIRLFSVILLGPMLARLVSRRLGAHS
jgi:hypothetical protein